MKYEQETSHGITRLAQSQWEPVSKTLNILQQHKKSETDIYINIKCIIESINFRLVRIGPQVKTQQQQQQKMKKNANAE